MSVRFAADVADTSAASSSASAPSAARHRPNNQTMTSMDFNEESRDTIDVKDSDTW